MCIRDRPKNDDIMLIYFTSGTTGMPKMAAHSWTYPIAQTVTAYYWHNVGDESIHMAVADTGWAKAGWGKLYGQWICGATLFVYDFDPVSYTHLAVYKRQGPFRRWRNASCPSGCPAPATNTPTGRISRCTWNRIRFTRAMRCGCR